MSELPRLMVVDDDQVTLELMHSLLRHKFKLALCIKSNEALAIAEKLRPRVVITDLKMPIVSGIQLCRQIKESEITANTPVIVYSGSEVEEDRLAALAAGADLFCHKSTSADELIDAIERFLDR